VPYTALAMEMTKNYGQKEYYEVILNLNPYKNG
jgi:hypothetical protein